MSRQYEVIGIGGMYLDVVASASYEFIEKHKIPLNGEVEIPPAKLKEILNQLSGCEFYAGGAVSNAIAGIANVGVSTGFFGKVAKDQIGHFLIDDFKHRGIDLCCSAYDLTAELSPLCIIILTENGERSMVFNQNCAANFSSLEVNHFNGAKFFLVEADILRNEKTAKVIFEAVSSAKKQSVKTVFNLQGMSSWGQRALISNDIAEFADIVIGNKEEVEAFEMSLSKPISSEQMIITTNGEHGVHARVSNVEAVVPAIISSNFVSSVGAGDQFIAGFLIGALAGKNLAECLQMGVKMASEILEQKGGRPPFSVQSEANKDMSYLQTFNVSI